MQTSRLTFTHGRCRTRASTVTANAERLGLRQSSWRFDHDIQTAGDSFPTMASWQFKTHLFVQFVSLSPKIPRHPSPATAGAPASKPAYGGVLQKLAICFQRTRKAGSETGAPKAKRPPSRGATKESSPRREPWVNGRN